MKELTQADYLLLIMFLGFFHPEQNVTEDMNSFLEDEVMPYLDSKGLVSDEVKKRLEPPKSMPNQYLPRGCMGHLYGSKESDYYRCRGCGSSGPGVGMIGKIPEAD